MVQKEINVSVVYLAWLPFGIGYFKQFINSYLKYDAGYPHDLIIAFNGVAIDHPDKKETYIEYLQNNGIHNYKCLYFKAGQDVETYRKVAAALNSDYVLFFNTYTQVKASNWLRFYIDNQSENIGIIGATGSYASYLRSINMKIKRDFFSDASMKKKFGYIKYILKLNLLFRYKFGKYPNPHIRTTAFFIKRELFCDLYFKKPKNKTEAYFFENGTKGLTKQILNRGLHCIIIDKSGKSYPIEQWPNSFTFWQGNQENLLISDNQTLKFEQGSPELKKILCREAWDAKWIFNDHNNAT